MLHPELVIFDCDGTLVDTEKLQLREQQRILSGLGVTLGEGYFTEHLTGKRFDTIMTQLAESHGVVFPSDTGALFKTRYQAALEAEETAIPHARDVLLALASRTKVCVASNGSHEGTCRHMQRLGVMPPLTPGQVFSAVSIGKLKPLPDIFLHAMRAMGESDPARVAVVEDSYTGLRAGLAAGMNVIWIRRAGLDKLVPPEFADTVAIVQDITELPGLLYSH